MSKRSEKVGGFNYYEGVGHVRKGKIVIPLVLNAIVVLISDKDNHDAQAYIYHSQDEENHPGMVGCCEYNRATKRIKSVADLELVWLNKSDVMPLVNRDRSSELLSEAFGDTRTWSDPPRNILRHITRGALVAYIPGKPSDKRQSLFDAHTLNEFVDFMETRTRDQWNTIGVEKLPTALLESTKSAQVIAQETGVAASTIRNRRKSLGIPPPRPGRLGRFRWAELWAEYSGKDISEFLKEGTLDRYKVEKETLDSIPEDELGAMVSANFLSKQYDVSEGLIKGRMNELGIPPSRPGNLSRIQWAELWAKFKNEPISNFLSSYEYEDYLNQQQREVA